MFYLTTHSTHFIYDYMTSDIQERTRKEGNILFNDALNTFYLRLYGIRHMVKDHSDSERGNLLPPHGLLFPISSKGSFICIIPQTGWHIPRPLLHQHWLEWEIAQWVHHEGSIWQPIAPWANALTTELHLASPPPPPQHRHTCWNMSMTRERVQ